MRIARLTKSDLAQLYVESATRSLAAIVHKGRLQPAGAAHRAQEYAQAQLDEYEIRREAQRARVRR